MEFANQNRPRGITFVAILMIIFGLAEIATGFRHNFFGVTTTLGTLSAFLGAGIGALYAAGGVLILIMKKWAATTALLFLAIIIIGRVTMAATGLFPLNSFEQIFAIIAGTFIAAAFAVYIGLRWEIFR